ncbi:MAG: RagB/SusD family nutrient uptake outer membrane protein [Paludibacter sp.]|nr:RagB/SusD family nutrient uptake outer membrane protein [Paludibacter sp.]
MKISKIFISFIMLATSFVSCDDYLTVLPENNQSMYDYWKTKEEVEAVLGAGYVKLRDAQEYLFLWGEARGNGVLFYNDGSDGEKAAKKLRQMEILETNALAKWDKLYAVINMANSVIKYGPDVVDRDESFNVNVMHSYLSEAYFQRALAYFYLVRLWKDVPFVKEPYVDDSAPYMLAATDGNTILESCLTDLYSALDAAKEVFPETDNENPINTKGRATKWAIYSLIADIQLWLGDYDNCISACESVMNSNRVGLLNGTLWFSNFYPGNSNESIFEIQYSYSLSQTNSFLSWFYTNINYTISPYMQELYEQNQGDIRGLDASYTEDLLIWKYIGISASTARNSSQQNDQNWIIYRMADIYLMEAEAYIMKGGEENMSKAIDLINDIRNRAGLVDENAGTNQLDMIKILLAERQREFFAEGKNWFDLMRIGKRDVDGFKNLFIDEVLQVASASNKGMIRAKLEDENSRYLPIHADELLVNTLLEQNPYYLNLGN